ncbi:probable GPN-loop GTPase 2 homolog [Saccharomycodes ludwigii]|uniref:GPN-loop GTPase 2 n=2 Tax=Saccharomycodes ludwigii TaxID=36035 RepID=A0A376B0W9_9ASCO|nr:probable GPN-loop GTPase 2 homolog [Saccharomycodes ludwigii]
MDPANDSLPYQCAVDIRDFITLEEIMDEKQLGPNGGLMYALESVENSLELFSLQVKSLLQEENSYLLFDCPGQVELFTHHGALFNIFKRLEKEMDLRLCVVNLIDSIYLNSASQYISIVLLSLRSMLMMDLPQINVFSKIDMLKQYGDELPFRLDYYTDVQELEYLQPIIEKESSENSYMGKKLKKLTENISEIISDFNLVSFEVLCIDDKQSMINLQMVIDKANGYVFGASEIGGDTVWAEATRQQAGITNNVYDIQERWIDNKEEYDKEEERKRKELLKEQEILDKPLENLSKELDPEVEWERAVKEWEEKT